jgi:hypothetical protein
MTGLRRSILAHVGFHRSASETPGSSRWRTKHRKALLNAGLPELVVASDRSLTYVLLHGNDAYGTRWDPSWLTREQATRLLAVLEPLLVPPAGYDILPRLRARLGAPEEIK